MTTCDLYFKSPFRRSRYRSELVVTFSSNYTSTSSGITAVINQIRKCQKYDRHIHYDKYLRLPEGSFK